MTYVRAVVAFALVVAASLGSYPANAQEPTKPATYGTSGLTSYVLDANDFGTFDSTGSWTANSEGRYLLSSPMILTAGIHIPNGAVIEALEVQGCDKTTLGDMQVLLFSWGVTPPTTINPFHGFVATGFANADGCQAWSSPLTPPVVVDNFRRTYHIWVKNIGEFGTKLSFQAVRVYYRLQVSPAPGTATFSDVPVGDPFHRFVEALVSAGITGGCGGGNYCPNAPVTRGQMAVFLAAALGLHWPN